MFKEAKEAAGLINERTRFLNGKHGNTIFKVQAKILEWENCHI